MRCDATDAVVNFLCIIDLESGTIHRQTDLAFIIGGTMGGFILLLFALIMVLIVVAFISCRAARDVPLNTDGKIFGNPMIS